MQIEKSIQLQATPEQLWTLLLDPNVMAACVPGMQSIEVVSPTEYRVAIKVKISFVSASFKIRTQIVEQQEPSYLRSEGQGEDAALASQLKHQSELFLAPTDDGQTTLRIVTQVDVLGRVGSFGLSAMKTKADRMWDEFSAKLKETLEARLAVKAG